MILFVWKASEHCACNKISIYTWSDAFQTNKNDVIIHVTFLEKLNNKMLCTKQKVKIAEKLKNVKIISKNYFFMNFEDMTTWTSLDENTSLRNLLDVKDPYCPHRQKNTFFGEVLNFRLNFRLLGRQDWSLLFQKRTQGWFFGFFHFWFFVAFNSRDMTMLWVLNLFFRSSPTKLWKRIFYLKSLKLFLMPEVAS